jgi:hypothetical protein
LESNSSDVRHKEKRRRHKLNCNHGGSRGICRICDLEPDECPSPATDRISPVSAHQDTSMRAFRITQSVCQSHAEMMSLLCPMQLSFRSITPSIANEHIPFLALFILVHIFTYPSRLVCNANMSGKKQASCQQPSMNSHTCAKSSSGERFDIVVFFLCSPDHHCIEHEATHPY